MKPWLADSDYQFDDGDAEVGVRMKAMLGAMNLEHFSFMILRPPRNKPFPIDETIRTSYPDAWLGRYRALRYFEVDPVADLSTRIMQPFYWGQGRFLRDFKKPQRLVFDEAKCFGISYGLAIPMHGPDGEVSVFNVVSSDKRHLLDATRSEHGRIFAAAYGTHDRVMREQIRLPFPGVEEDVELSIRERECLAWTLEGKTAGEIATILNLSVSTVNHHALSATRKLGSLNKHHAAVTALRGGLIQ
ncbi:autoinducer binding domain-containing protein [Hoeflea sp. WL0058]|uniref:Autoinducer binding domain-containing protein n=1 Tax=Flavimaribacter sediminis TaxID=2865987 RepID=A0AAE2ZJ30_9HYPH|nr:autoinducer binding domain-containing protein [Flavimaribacter sediminis]MBW8635652.1 autoinducer binding domain-containing protein [Flavimaribacter sediminis]